VWPPKPKVLLWIVRSDISVEVKKDGQGRSATRDAP
jgi:hypothetical protein